jgi:radical SAM superfamily enzyme YgiQ (UPF0313 family)
LTLKTMSRSLYLINPTADFATYFSAECFAGRGCRPATLIADLAITTLAAMTPSGLDCHICDENVSAVDFDASVDFVGVTGKITQWERMKAISREFRERGKTVLIGGPYASLCPEVVRPHCDILVQGETEDIFEELCADLINGCPKSEYVGGRPDLTACALPKWDTYLNERAIMGSVQTSRGCPFECDYCDVIQYVGQKQRHKPIAHVLAELDEVSRRGYRSVFLADDNFTVHRSRAKELLAALRDWNFRHCHGRFRFTTQVSIDAAKDQELLEMCAKAGLSQVFIGIETPNEDSLRESKKRQNVGFDLTERIECFLEHGIAVIGGMIVGFDADGPDIFERQFKFAMSTPVPVFSIGALVAPAATPLYHRMSQEGRLRPDGSEVAAMPWNTNIVPRGMTHEELLRGIKVLCNRLYSPRAFGERILRFIEIFGKNNPCQLSNRSVDLRGLRAVEFEGLDLFLALVAGGRDETEMWLAIRKALSKRPTVAEFVVPMLVQYNQIRYMYEQGQLWDSALSTEA